MIAIDPKFARLFPELSGAPPIKQRYIILTGGRGSMKSFTSALWVCWNTLFPRQRTLYTRYTLTAADISIIPEFEEKIHMLGLWPIFKVRKTWITNTQTGSDIIFSGIKTSAGNQTARLKSIPGLNVFVIDEAEEFTSERDFDTINESIRAAGVANRVIIVMNPSTTEHWIYKRFFAGYERYEEINGHKVTLTAHPDVYHIHTTYLDNTKNLSQSFLEEAEKLRLLAPGKYAHRLLGVWQKQAEGVIYENWEEGLFDESLPSIFGLDEGFSPDPLALVKVAVDKRLKRIYLRECVYEQRLSSEAIAERLRRYCRRNDLIVADDKGRLIAEIKDKGFNIVKAVKYPDSVKEGIRKIHDYRIIVDPHSQNLKTELNNYRWNDKKSSTPADGFDHLMDAFRYAFMKLNSGKKTGIKRRN